MARQYIFVHIWDDNANPYGSIEAALDGIASEYNDSERAAVKAALEEAIENPGEGVSIDGGMSTVRYLSITE